MTNDTERSPYWFHLDTEMPPVVWRKATPIEAATAPSDVPVDPETMKQAIEEYRRSIGWPC